MVQFHTLKLGCIAGYRLNFSFQLHTNPHIHITRCYLDHCSISTNYDICKHIIIFTGMSHVSYLNVLTGSGGVKFTGSVETPLVRADSSNLRWVVVNAAPRSSFYLTVCLPKHIMCGHIMNIYTGV